MYSSTQIKGGIKIKKRFLLESTTIVAILTTLAFGAVSICFADFYPPEIDSDDTGSYPLWWVHTYVKGYYPANINSYFLTSDWAVSREYNPCGVWYIGNLWVHYWTSDYDPGGYYIGGSSDGDTNVGCSGATYVECEAGSEWQNIWSQTWYTSGYSRVDAEGA